MAWHWDPEQRKWVQDNAPFSWPANHWKGIYATGDFHGGAPPSNDPPRTINWVRGLQEHEARTRGGFLGSAGGDFADHWQTDRFDMFSWYEAGANTQAFFSAAGADNLARIVRNPIRLERLASLNQKGLFQDEIERVLDFYGRQYFTYREEGKDVEEAYKSIIGPTPLGQFVESALDQRITDYENRLARVSAKALETLQEKVRLQAAYQNNEITWSDYGPLRDDINRTLNQLRQQQRFLGSKRADYLNYAWYRPGLQDITKQARDLDLSITPWEEITRDWGLTRNQRDLLNALVSNPPEMRSEYRRLLGAIDPRLTRLLPLEREEQTLISHQYKVNEAYNFLALRASGAIGSQSPTEAIFRAKGMYGLQGRINGLVDLNSWELTRGGTSLERTRAPIGSPRLGIEVTPSEITSTQFLSQLGLRPGFTPDLPSSNVLRVLSQAPANRAWYSGENPQYEEAADLVYGRISRRIRTMVSDAMQALGPLPDVEPTVGHNFFRSLLDHNEAVTPQNIAQQLIGYYHAAPHFRGPNDYGNALHAILIGAAKGDPFSQQVKAILSKAIPGIEGIEARQGSDGTYYMYKGFRDEYFNAIEKAFKAQGITTRKGLLAQVPEAYEHITRPRSVNERMQAFSAAEEVELGDMPAEMHLIERVTSGDQLSDEIEVAQTALKLHDLELQADILEHKVRSLSDAAERRMYNERLLFTLRQLNTLQDDLRTAPSVVRDQINAMLHVMTPLRAAEYYRAGLPASSFPMVGGKVPKGVTPIIMGPEGKEEVQRLVGVLNSGNELAENWRLNYLLSRYSKTSVQLAAEQEARHLGRVQEQVDFMSNLKRTGIGAARIKGMDMQEAYSFMANYIGKRYNMPQMTELIRDAMLHEEGAPQMSNLFHARTLHEFRDNLLRYEGTNFDITEGPFQRYYRQLGGEGPLQLSLAQVEPSDLAEGGELYAKNKTMHTVEGSVTAKFELPEYLTNEEKARSLAALQTPKFMEEWEGNPAYRQITEYYKKHNMLSEQGIQAVMERARQMIAEADHQFHILQSFATEDLTPTGRPFSPDEYEELTQKLIDILSRNIGSRKIIEGIAHKYDNEHVGREEIVYEAQRLAQKIGEFSTHDWGKIVVPVSNNENIRLVAPLNKYAPIVGPRNTVTKDRFEQNLRAADHYFNFNRNAMLRREPGKLNASLLSHTTMPMVNGETLTRSFFSDALEELDSALQAQDMNLGMLEKLTNVIGAKGVWVGRKTISPDVQDKIRELLGGDNIRGPLALGAPVDIGGNTTKSVAEVFANFLSTRSMTKAELLQIAQRLNIDLGTQDVSKLSRKDILRFMRTRAGINYFDPEVARQQLVAHFIKQANLLRHPDVLEALTPEQRERIQSIFNERQQIHEAADLGEELPPELGEPGMRAADIGRQAEEEIRRVKAEAAKPGFTPFTMEELRRVWGNKRIKQGTMALGAFALWGLIRSHQAKEHTLAKMQGPQNQPGGNTPYTQDVPPPNLTALPANVYAQPKFNAPGYIYRVRATGKINPDKFQTQVMNITDSPISSGSIYDSRGMPNPDNDMYNTMKQYQ